MITNKTFKVLVCACKYVCALVCKRLNKRELYFQKMKKSIKPNNSKNIFVSNADTISNFKLALNDIVSIH